eukprot:2593532-Prymnesium_polylepis.1
MAAVWSTLCCRVHTVRAGSHAALRAHPAPRAHQVAPHRPARSLHAALPLKPGCSRGARAARGRRRSHAAQGMAQRMGMRQRLETSRERESRPRPEEKLSRWPLTRSTLRPQFGLMLCAEGLMGSSPNRAGSTTSTRLPGH